MLAQDLLGRGSSILLVAGGKIVRGMRRNVLTVIGVLKMVVGGAVEVAHCLDCRLRKGKGRGNCRNQVGGAMRINFIR